MSLHLIAKVTILVLLAVIVSGSLPRYRVDQLISQNWRFYIFFLLGFFFFFVVVLAISNNGEPWEIFNGTGIWVRYSEINESLVTAEFWIDVYFLVLEPRIGGFSFFWNIFWSFYLQVLCFLIWALINIVVTIAVIIINC